MNSLLDTEYDDVTIRKKISETEGIPEEWLWFDVGNSEYFGTIIPAKFICGREGYYMNNKVFKISDYE